jgi:hypothetical protein
VGGAVPFTAQDLGHNWEARADMRSFRYSPVGAHVCSYLCWLAPVSKWCGRDGCLHHPFSNQSNALNQSLTTHLFHIQTYNPTQVVGDPEDRCTFTYDWGGGDVPPDYRCPHSM